MNIAGRRTNQLESPSLIRTGGQYDETSSGNAALQDISFYTEAPSLELSLDEFEEFALARLKVLRKIEEVKSRNLTLDNYRKSLESSLKSNLPWNANSNHLDQASHFILRAAYCQSEDLRRWFLSQETTLFKFRLVKISRNPLTLRSFLHQANIKLDSISPSEKESLRPFLLALSPSPSEFLKTEYYRIPFTQALELVSSRQVYLSKGYAYVPTNKLISILSARFRMQLSKSLVLASHAFSSLSEEEDRIFPLLQNMNSVYMGPQFNQEASTGTLTPNTIEGMVKSMPLCMRNVHTSLKRDRHLRYHARLQYGLFLKGGGMTMEDSLAFLQKMFSKFTSEEFSKKYSYNIRHVYGKEGKRESKSPYNCIKIIKGPIPGAGEFHGCPFRHFDEENLSTLLGKCSINSKEKDEILGEVRKQNFNLACVRHFEAEHKDIWKGKGSAEGIGNLGNHPNAWFSASQDYWEKNNGSDKIPA